MEKLGINPKKQVRARKGFVWKEVTVRRGDDIKMSDGDVTGQTVMKYIRQPLNDMAARRCARPPYLRSV